MHRRHALQLLTGAAMLPRSLFAFGQHAESSSATLSAADTAFLDDMQRRACLFFHEQASPHTGQVLDRAVANSTGKLDARRMASIAATGLQADGATGTLIFTGPATLTLKRASKGN